MRGPRLVGDMTVQALLVCTSISAYRNTERIAHSMASALGAEVVAPRDVTTRDVAAFGLVGFGSGIYSFTFHPDLWRLARALPRVDGAGAFVFSTSGGPEYLFRPSTILFEALLHRRGYQMSGRFSCRGAYDWGTPRLPRGNVGRPNDADLALARRHAEAWSSAIIRPRRST